MFLPLSFSCRIPFTLNHLVTLPVRAGTSSTDRHQVVPCVSFLTNSNTTSSTRTNSTSSTASHNSYIFFASLRSLPLCPLYDFDSTSRQFSKLIDLSGCLSACGLSGLALARLPYRARSRQNDYAPAPLIYPSNFPNFELLSLSLSHHEAHTAS